VGLLSSSPTSLHAKHRVGPLHSTQANEPALSHAHASGESHRSHIGIVVVGRNEGERLRTCLASVADLGTPLVYVDSGSVDQSVQLAREHGVDVIELDDSKPYTAARARNAGFDWLLERRGDLEFVQFVDGDCELSAGWLERGAAVMNGRPDVAVVCGRVRERAPHASIYNRLCELEWKQATGEIDGCGGNMLMRVKAFREIGGFNPDVIAAEDTELCARLQMHGWKIFSVDTDMVVHDAAMLRFSQWYRRAVRAGHAMTEGAVRHGRRSSCLFTRSARRIFLFGTLIPLGAVAFAWPTGGWSLALLGVYPVQFVKTYAGLRRRGETRADALAYSSHCTLAKFPQAHGQMLYGWNRLRGRRTRLIEHKRPETRIDPGLCEASPREPDASPGT